MGLFQKFRDHLNQNLFNYGFNTQQSGQESNYSLPNMMKVAYGPTQSLGYGTDEGFASSQTGKDPIIGPAYNPDLAVNNTNTSGGYVPPSGNTDDSGDVSLPKPDMGAINDVYNPIISFLNQEESRISGQMPSVLQSAQEAFNVSQNTLSGSRDSGNQQLASQGISAEQARQNEMNEQRRLYEELTMGGNQRFGGASSASEAYNALLGREQQRVGAITQQQFQTAKREIEVAKYNLEQDYNNKLMSLQQQLRETQTNIRNEFSDRLAQIRGMRAESESAKANAKLGALQQYQSEMYNLRMATMQYEQQLKSQAQAYASQISQAESYYDQLAQQGAGAVNTFNNQTAGVVDTNLRYGAQGPGSSGKFTPTGQITSTGKKDEDNIFASIFGGGGGGGGGAG